MTSQYEQSEKDIAEKLRTLVEPLRTQFDTKEEQAVCLQGLGDLYLKAGVESKNGKDFTKAAALFHAALVRTSIEEVQKKIKGRLVVVRQEFMTAFYPDAELIVQEQWEEIRLQNIRTLEKIRTNIKENSLSLKVLMVRYDIEAKDILEIETGLVNEATKVTLLVQKEMLGFIRVLWNKSMELSNSTPPCKYSMMGLGSLARQEVTPYSDLEFAILVEENNGDVQRYFKNLTNLFHLSVLDLGETPIPQIAIPSLNDFMTPGGDWFFDKITPSGFKLDAEMPWACKTPTGRQATPNKSQLSFIKTPVEMAKLMKDDSVLGQSYHVADVLSRTVHILDDLSLHDIYQQEVGKIMDFRSNVTLYDEISEISKKDKPYRNAKHTYYRLLSVFVEHMKQSLTPSFQGNSQWFIVDNFTKVQKMSEEDAFELKVITALAYGVRLITYFHNGGQREKIKSDQFSKDVRDSIGTKINICLLNNMMRFSCSIAGLDTPSDLMSQTMELVKLASPHKYIKNPPLLRCFCNNYFFIAIEDLVLPDLRCGDTCQNMKIFPLDSEIPNIDDLDFLLKNKHLCKCVFMMKTYLEVHRYCTQKYLKLTTDPPDAYLNGIFKELSKCPSVRSRDMLFLNFNLLKLASFSTDVTILKRVAKSAEKFLNTEVPRFLKGTRYEPYFHVMTPELYGWLNRIYEFLDESEKVITLLERLINVMETYHPGGDFDIEHILVYTGLAKALFKNPEKEEEGIRLYHKVLQILENEVRSNSSIDNEEQLAANVLIFADMLLDKERCDKVEALLKDYFFNDNKSFNFTNDHIMEALLLLGSCYASSWRWMECTQVCGQIYRMVKYEGVGENLSVLKRFDMGFLGIWSYGSCENSRDMLKEVAKLHKLVCNMQKDKALAVLEHKIFLLTSSLNLFAIGLHVMGRQYVKQALALEDLTTHSIELGETSVLLHILVVLWDALDRFTSFEDMGFVFKNYKKNTMALEGLSKRHKTNLYEIYVDYRLCHCLFSITMDPDRRFVLKLKETTDYLYQTQTRLTEFFPKCSTAIEWCQDAILLLNPNAENVIPQDYIQLISLINKTRYSNRIQVSPWMWVD